jgi:tetratricopeptide (TPR) repeat protein
LFLVSTSFGANVLLAQDTDPKPAASPTPTAVNSATPAGAPVAALELPPLEQARMFFRTGNFAAAIEQYNLALKSNSNDAAPYAGLARIYLAQNKIADAFAAASKAVELGPALAAAHAVLGDVYFRQGKFMEAERQYLIPVRAGILDARSYYGLSRINSTVSNTRHAKLLLDKAYGLDSEDPEIFHAWILTTPLADRSTYLNTRIAGNLPKSEEERKSLQYASNVFDSEAKQENHSCHLISNVSSATIRLRRLMMDSNLFRGHGVEVKVNGTSSELLLDTGASGILINSKLAEKIGVRHIMDRGVGGIGDKGAARGYIGYANSIKIGALEFQGCLIDVVDNKRSLGENGLIGSDVFQSFLVDINFQEQKLNLSPLPAPLEKASKAGNLESSLSTDVQLHDRYVAPEMKDFDLVFRIGHMLLIPTFVNKSASKFFLIDTGAYSNSLSLSAAREITKVHQDDYTVIEGLSGKVKYVYTADKVKLAFGHFTQEGEDVNTFDFTDLNQDAGTEISGILGYSLLWMLDIKIDYRDSLVKFTADPRFVH